MNEEQAREAIDDYIEGALSGADRQAFEAAMADHPSLRDDVEEARRLEEEIAALPRERAPERDLWPGIEDRIQHSGRLIDFGRAHHRHTKFPLTRYLIAAAAVALMVIGAPIMLNRSLDTPPAPAPPPISADPELHRAAAQYLDARQQLLDVLNERRDEIAPETLQVVDENLAVIASAVDDIETALAADQSNQQLEQMLHAAYRSEVRLLQQAVELTEPTDMPDNADEPGGNDSDA